MKYLLIGIVLVIALVVLTGCSNKNENSNTNTATTKTNNTQNTNTNKEENSMSNVDYAKSAQKQMSKPESGETVAIIKVKDYGEVKVKFFPEIAPKAVENFVTHAKDGYYNGLTFHRVMEEFMIQGGDPKGDGTGGESIWGEGFGTELNESLVPYRGSLCMAMSKLPNSIGSQFFIVQANYSDAMESYLKLAKYPTELINEYKKYGGYLSLYMQYTVFGQVYEGMDVVDKIAKVETQISSIGEKSIPAEDIIIQSIEVTTYSEK